MGLDPPMTAWLNRILQRLLPNTWDRAVHRVAIERGLTDAEVRARLEPPPPQPKEPPAPRNPYPG